MRFKLGRHMQGRFPERQGARNLIVFLILAVPFALPTVSCADVNADAVVIIDGNVSGADVLLAGLESGAVVEFIDPPNETCKRAKDLA